jgi:hypothetical protein
MHQEEVGDLLSFRPDHHEQPNSMRERDGARPEQFKKPLTGADESRIPAADLTQTYQQMTAFSCVCARGPERIAMTTDNTLSIHEPGDSSRSNRSPSDSAGLPGTPSSAIVRLMQELGLERDYFYQIGRHKMDRGEAHANYEDISRRHNDAWLKLVRRARRNRIHPGPSLISWDDPGRVELEDAIKSRLDLPTFIARHSSLTAVGFRRLDDVLVCPCPLPDDTHVDAWLYVDPMGQTWFCTGCEAGGDILDFAYYLYGLQHESLWTFMAREAGLTLPPILRK